MARKENRAVSVAPSTFERLNSIQERTQAATGAEVVRNAVRIYEYLLTTQLAGGQLLVRTIDGQTNAIQIVL
jgi:hypothetical protein